LVAPTLKPKIQNSRKLKLAATLKSKNIGWVGARPLACERKSSISGSRKTFLKPKSLFWDSVGNGKRNLI
jgi:hypothetical protein